MLEKQESVVFVKGLNDGKATAPFELLTRPGSHQDRGGRQASNGRHGTLLPSQNVVNLGRLESELERQTGELTKHGFVGSQPRSHGHVATDRFRRELEKMSHGKSDDLTITRFDLPTGCVRDRDEVDLILLNHETIRRLMDAGKVSVKGQKQCVAPRHRDEVLDTPDARFPVYKITEKSVQGRNKRRKSTQSFKNALSIAIAEGAEDLGRSETGLDGLGISRRSPGGPEFQEMDRPIVNLSQSSRVVDQFVPKFSNVLEIVQDLL